MIKKPIMIVVKFLIGLVPQFIRNELKTSPRLTSIYSKSLQKHGLSYGLPSKRKSAKLYAKVVLEQESQLAKLPLSKKLKLDIVVVCASSKLVSLTLDSLDGLSFVGSAILLVSNPEKYDNYTVPDKYSFGVCLSEKLDLSANASNANCQLLINAGDALHPDIDKVIELALLGGDLLHYFDVDIKSRSGRRLNPKFHCDWDPDFQLSAGYVDTGVLINKSVIVDLNIKLVASHCTIADLMVDIYLNEKSLAVNHLPFVMIHSHHAAKKAQLPLGEHVLNRISQFADIKSHEKYSVLKLCWHAHQLPKVSLIIPTRNSKSLVAACIDSILEKTSYTNYEILLVDNQSDEKESLKYFESLSRHPKITVLRYEHEFNYSAINNFAAAKAKGTILGLINNDVEVIEPLWLAYMVGHVNRKEIGCVGAKLLYTDGRVQHAGVVMGYGGGAGHAHKYFPKDHAGYLNRLAATNRFSAVTAACLLVKKDDFNSVHGLDEDNLTVAFNDVDFCLKVRALGRSNLYCSEAVLFHHESVSRGFDDTKEKMQRFNSELRFLQTKWRDVIRKDPAYSPYLTLKRENFATKEFG